MTDLERSTAAVPARANEQAELENLPTLFGRLGDDVMTLLDTKLNLLKIEVKEDADKYVRSGVMIAIGGVIAAIGFALVNVAVAFFVSTLFAFQNPALNYALGFIITGAAYLLIGGILIMLMKSKLSKVDPVPHRSVEELRKDKQWLKKEI
ncbi:MAG: phage holin family protein [Acidobacteria bacterium]|nr:phage holin family protein [Acidobacteriota bacterium]